MPRTVPVTVSEPSPAALAIPKGRPAEALGYAQRFVERAKAEGWVKSAIGRAGLRGVVVAGAQ